MVITLFELLAIIIVTAVTFVGTSLDNLLLLIGFLGVRDYRKLDVMLGYTAALALVVAAVFGLSAIAHLAPQRYIAYLGLVPIALGLLHLYRLISHSVAAPHVPEREPVPSVALSVGLVMLANSGDTLAALAILFADSRTVFLLPMIATLFAMVAVWGAIAGWLVSHPRLAGTIRIIARYALPFLLIAVGWYVLNNTATDVVPGS